MEALSIDLSGILFVLSYGLLRIGLPVALMVLLGSVLQRITAPAAA